MVEPTYIARDPAGTTGEHGFGVSDFGGQVNDGNQITVQGAANGLVLQDRTGKTSPLSSAEFVEITPPVNALRVHLEGAFTIATDADGANGAFSANNAEFDIARVGKFYLKGTDVSFAFEVL